MRLVGFKYKTRNEGNFRMEVEASLEHSYDKSNWFLRIMWWLYWYLFYQKARMEYIDLCQDYADRFIAKIKDMYDIESTKVE